MHQQVNMMTRPRAATVIALCCGALSAWSACGVSLPQHVAQAPQMEAYTQQYTFCAETSKMQVWLADKILGRTEYSPNPLRFDTIVVRGSVYFRMMLPPNDDKHFFFEGLGWHKFYYGDVDPIVERDSAAEQEPAPHAAFRVTSLRLFDWAGLWTVTLGEAEPVAPRRAKKKPRDVDYLLLGKADYRIEDDGPIPMTQLKKGYLTIRIRVSTTDTNDSEARYQSSDVFVKLHIRRLAKKVYTIDYDQAHEIGVAVKSNGRWRLVRPIGTMHFTTPPDGRHLFDVRHLERLPLATYPSGEAYEARPPLTPLRVEWLNNVECPDEL